MLTTTCIKQSTALRDHVFYNQIEPAFKDHVV